jgi:hypothetical protein
MDKICKMLQNREIGVFSRRPLAQEMIEISDDEVAQGEIEHLLFHSVKTKWMKCLQYGADMESGFQIVDFG